MPRGLAAGMNAKIDRLANTGFNAPRELLTGFTKYENGHHWLDSHDSFDHRRFELGANRII